MFSCFANRKTKDRILQTILVSSPFAVIVMNEKSVILEWSEKAHGMLGWTREQVIGKCLHDFILPKGKHIEGVHSYMKSGTMLDKSSVLLTALHRDGDTVPIALTLSSQTTKNGDLYV